MGLIEQDDGIWTVGLIWGLQEQTNPDPPCGFCSTDEPVDREQEANINETRRSRRMMGRNMSHPQLICFFNSNEQVLSVLVLVRSLFLWWSVETPSQGSLH